MTMNNGGPPPLPPPLPQPPVPLLSLPRRRGGLIGLITALAAVLILGGGTAALAASGAFGTWFGSQPPQAATVGDGAPPETRTPTDQAPAAEVSEPLVTYHHEGFGVWFDLPSSWSVEPFPSRDAAEARGFLVFSGCGNARESSLDPVRVLDGEGVERSALGIRERFGGCAGQPDPSTVQVIEEERVYLSGRAPAHFVYLTTADPAGGRHPVMGITTEDYRADAFGIGMSFWAQSDTPETRYELSFGSTSSFDPAGSSRSALDSELPSFADAAEAEAFTETSLYQDLKSMYLSLRYQESADTVNGDLGLAQPVSYPACDGSQIAVLGTAWTPGAYASEIQAYLDAFPDARYSRTDYLCSAFLRPVLDNSDDQYIYFVYVPTGADQAATCAAVANAAPLGGNTHGKWLRNTEFGTEIGRPGEQVPC